MNQSFQQVSVGLNENNAQNKREILHRQQSSIFSGFSSTAWLSLRDFGETILAGMDRVGETVADILGLNDSKFQYVLDGMTEEDWRRAREIQRKREEESTLHLASKQASILESGDQITNENMEYTNKQTIPTNFEEENLPREILSSPSKAKD